MNLVLMGAPGAGKGTQGDLLSAHLGIPKVATGDLLRSAVRQGTPLGVAARALMDAGKLVPDNVIYGIVKEALTDPSASNGVILDGVIRNTAQLDEVERMFAALGRKLDAVIMIDVPAEEIVRRVSGRRTAASSGRIFNLFDGSLENWNEAQDGPLTVRDDDREETVRRRLEVYESTTRPVMDAFASKGYPIISVDGNRAVNLVQGEISNRLAALK